MSRHVILSALWPVLGLGWAVPAIAIPFPSADDSTIPDHLVIVGRSGTQADPGYPFTVVLRSDHGVPIAYWDVLLDFSATDVELCTDQGPGMYVDCTHRIVQGWTDAVGSVTFHVVGCVRNSGGSPGSNGKLVVFADSFPMKSSSVAVLDQNGCEGVNGNDLSSLLGDIFTGRTFMRSDYDFDGALGGNDLSIWLAAMFSGASAENCRTAVCP